MVQTIIGCVAFLLFFIGDYNDWKVSSTILKACFPVGVVMLVISFAYGIYVAGGIARIVFLIPAALFLLLLIYTLFFALPAKDAYMSQHNGRSVCSSGMYEMCRHPGVLWFLCLSICLYFMGIYNFSSLVAYNILNLLLIIFEDIYVFPATIAGYDQYKLNVPFLIPNIKRINLVGNKSYSAEK